MFIEKLKERDFDNYADSLNCSVSEMKLKYNKEKNENYYYVRLFNGAMGPQPELTITDFSITANSYYKDFEKSLEKNWRKQMIRTFGDNYSTALKEHFTKEFNENCSIFNDKTK